jgi:hypothetical protein
MSTPAQRVPTSEMHWHARRWLALARIQADIEFTAVAVPYESFKGDSGLREQMTQQIDLVPLVDSWRGDAVAVWIGTKSYSGSLKGRASEDSSPWTAVYNAKVSGVDEGHFASAVVQYAASGALRATMTLVPDTKAVYKGTNRREGHSESHTLGDHQDYIELDLIELGDPDRPLDAPWEMRGHFDPVRPSSFRRNRHFTWQLVATPAPVIRTIDIWMNAFIPGSVPGVTMPRPNHSGETMVAGLPFGDCFLTDQRSFDARPSSSSRMQQRIRVDLSTNEVLAWRRCDPTVAVHSSTGAWTEEAVGDSSRISMTVTESTNGIGTFISDDLEIPTPSVPSSITISVKGEARNPLISATKIMGDVDWEGTWTITVKPDMTEATVSFEGLIDESPAFEAYASTSEDGADPVTLFQRLPPPGSTPAKNLPGNANLPVSGTATLMPPQARREN